VWGVRGVMGIVYNRFFRGFGVLVLGWEEDGEEINRVWRF
jgi:hypothetical protein